MPTFGNLWKPKERPGLGLVNGQEVQEGDTVPTLSRFMLNYYKDDVSLAFLEYFRSFFTEY
jgi:hypothetical protein